MNREFFEALIVSPAFEKLPKTTRSLLNSVMSTPATAMDTKAVTVKEDVESGLGDRRSCSRGC